MDHEDDALPINSNIKCHVCGENEFEECEGFYYCQECGTKQEQVRLVEVERDDDFNQDKLKTKKLKVQLAKTEKPQLTSWECYNYILRGFVEELLSFGAKEELKLMTLQVWAAYLRRMEVAFFNRKQADLPKLGAKYFQNDAETLYNHSKARKKRNRRRSEDASCTSGGESSARDWRRNKRKLDESNYSLTSATSATSGGSAFNSSTSANSNKAIKLAFNTKARSFFKRTMPKKHIDKHAADAEGQLTCHKQPLSREINRTEYNLMVMNTKQIFAVLGIALNLIGDEIQLCDLIRFLNEGHISTTNVLQYFPENIANHGKEMLRKINFYKCSAKYSDKYLRDHIGIMCKHIGIHRPIKPDIVRLVKRYITDLCLPNDLADYIERLINLMPPQFESRSMAYYPAYEARAMAYIVFTLKLFFGLDGFKEQRMSLAAQKLNKKIESLNRKNFEMQPLLFVWNDWLEYIEMRKVIISHFNSAYCEQFKQCESTAQVLEEMSNTINRNEERDNLLNDVTDNKATKDRLKIFRSIFDRFLETYKDNETDKKTPQLIEFKPTFTPSYSYLKSILLFYDSQRDTNSTVDISIPDFMRIDHAQRDISSYLKVKPLIEYFKKHQLKLNVHSIATTNNKMYVGIFRPPRTKRQNFYIQKACFDITEEEWSEFVVNNVAPRSDDLGFKTDLKTYGQVMLRAKKVQEKKKKQIFDPFMNYDLTMIIDEIDDDDEKNENIPNRSLVQNKSTNHKNNSLSVTNEDLQSMHSFELFSENNMDPIDDQNLLIRKPRRNLEDIDLFEGISDEEHLLKPDDFDEQPDVDNSQQDNTIFDLSSNPSRPSTPPILEEFIKVEPASPNNSSNCVKQRPTRKLTKDKSLKMYISNMDCWMLLGNMLMLNKGQKCQLQDKFPRSFTWLLETCAQTINVEWAVLYEQLLCIELMFCMGIKDPKTIKNCVYINSDFKIKEIQSIFNTYREIW